MKKIFLLIITAAMLSPAMAQDEKATRKNKKEEKKLRISAIAKQEEEGVIKYKKHTLFGVKLTTDGYGAFMEISRAQSVRRAILFQLDIAERKHQKEDKESYPNLFYGGVTSPIAFGKLNYFYPIKLGVQEQYLLGNKGNKNGISITGNAGGGFVAGLLRPYMIKVFKNDNSEKYVKYDPTDTSNTVGYFLNTGDFLEAPNLGTGWNQLKCTPGIYGKTAVRFDFGKYNEMVNALEVGLTGEYYIKKIPQMVFNKERKFFFSGYVSVMFGKRK